VCGEALGARVVDVDGGHARVPPRQDRARAW
jgi:hypothetical protein